MLTSLSVEKILLQRFVNLSSNFRGLSLELDVPPSRLKRMNIV